MTNSIAALDSVFAFTIDVTGVTIQGDSAEVRYREHMDAGWRVARFVQVPR